jgi:hypothetical protein
MPHGGWIVRQQASDGVLRRRDQMGRDHRGDEQVPTFAELA